MEIRARRFATHESFPAVAYNVIARHNSINAVFLRTHLNPMLAARASTVTSAQFAEQMQYEADFLHARRTNQPLPEQPASCAAVFDLKSGIETGLKAYWGSNQEREDARSNVFSMCNEFGPPHVMFTFSPDASNSFSVFEYCDKTKYDDISDILNSSFPSKSRRKEIVGDNPYAAAFHYNAMVNIIIEHIFGWDQENECAKSSPGYFGNIKAFFGSTEAQNSLNLHCHFLIWYCQKSFVSLVKGYYGRTTR